MKIIKNLKTIEDVLERYKSDEPRIFKRSENYYEAFDDPDKLTLTEFSQILERIIGVFYQDIEVVLFDTFVVYGSPEKWTTFKHCISSDVAESDTACWQYDTYSLLEHHKSQSIILGVRDVYFINADQICAVAANWGPIKLNYDEKKAIMKTAKVRVLF